MENTVAKLKFKENNYEIIEPGDHVICAVSKKKILLKNLNYWNVELQEPYYSPVEVKQRYEELKNKITSNDYELKSIG